MTSPALPTAPPLPAILQCATDLATALGKVGEAQAVFLTTDEKKAALQQLVAVEAQVHELLLRVMAAAGDVVEETGSHDIAAWLAATSRVRISEARHDQKLAAALDDRYPAIAEAMRSGAVNTTQAHVITGCLDTLVTYAEVDAETLARAEEHLVAQAAHYGPRPLAKLAQHVLDVIAPEIADEADARRLATLEADAATKSRLSLRRQGDGTTRVSGLLPDVVATRLATYLEAFTNPRIAGHDDPERPAGPETSGTPDILTRLPYPKKLGQAFGQFLETIDPRRLPLHGGDATTLIVTMTLDQLRADLATADILGAGAIPGSSDPASWTGGDQITAAQARRLACNAGIVPAVLGSKSEILDLGRTARLFSRAQHRAMALRDRTCRAEGCDRPARWCEAHHLRLWSEGGSTDIDDGALLCAEDHHRIHDPDYGYDLLPNGDIRFHRRS